jgi:hypothetical protein
MKYFNKTRTIEEKSNQREIMTELKKQTEILQKLLEKQEK